MSWEVFFPISILLLFIALGFGYWRAKQQSAREREITEIATHEMKKNPRAYEDHEREELEKEAKKA